MKTTVFSALSALAFTSCAHHVGFHSSHLGFHEEAEYAQPSAIPCYPRTPLRYTVYYGSDAQWHYFESLRDLKLERYKVPRSALRFPSAFPVGKGRLDVTRNNRGELVSVTPRELPRRKK